ncbi:hypothetical protein [Kitasatospora cathayae]|uniref:LamG-like jellyroll fold domain-containing protein n=1 Tax=Kitasatospora cathayae TaxID=3004092 RepID=A0ABY7QA65_9ACTN|nr:hypothetical protein [Kitasatospora sp. HUAS 3-15]WBP89543.1 hypothetical protein O1G21_29340 [Kitasatospora sp. HUAS 3-15]
MATNPNWPLVQYNWGPAWNVNRAGVPSDSLADITSRSRSRTSIRRGRQYELDQIRSGTADVVFANTDGALDPANSSGPWYGRIAPYQPLRVRAQWPPTPNLLLPVQATGGDAGGFAVGSSPVQPGVSVFSNTDSSGGQITSSATAWQGSRVFQFAVPSGSASNTIVAGTRQASAERNATYTMQIQVRNITPSTSVQVAAVMIWNSGAAPTPTSVSGTQIAGSPATLAGSASAPWTQLTVTGTLGPNATWVAVGIILAASTTAATNIQIDGWQLERGTVATAWTAPGTWYSLYGGYVERYPSSWTMSGTYGTVQTTSVDAISLLSQRVLRDPLTEEIYSRSPRFLYPLGDPQGSQSVADSVGAYPPAPLIVSKFGAGSLTFGNQITSATVGGAYTGGTGTVATVANPSPGAFAYIPATLISLDQAGIKGPADPTSWTRMIAFRYTGPVPSDQATIWCCTDSTRSGHYPQGSQATVSLNSSGKPVLYLSGPSGVAVVYTFGGATNCADSNWHLLLFSYSQATNQVMASQDGTLAAYYGSVPSSSTPTGLRFDSVGGWVDPVYGNETLWGFQGDISYVAEWPTAFGTTDITAVYTAWKNSFTGDSSDARYKRILGWAGFGGQTTVQAGLTSSMGPAAVAGQDAMTALQGVVDTENGEHFVAADGTLVFRARSARYNALVPMYVLGERADLGEIPYEECRLDYDPTRLGNLVKITQASTSQVFTASDATSQASYFPRSLSRTINSSSAQECQDAANYLLSRYKQPAVRVASIKLHPSANPGIWAACLSLELGTRVRVMRRPPAPAAAIQIECFVESIEWTLGDNGDAYLSLQCSPADLTPYGLFASFHTTLSGSPTAGVTSVTINAGADSTNPAAAQIGQGQQLVLGLGTANQETVTVKSVSATTSGWTTAVVTLTAATTKSHSAGDTVCEPLPSGVTDPTTWDNSAKFDSCAFSY